MTHNGYLFTGSDVTVNGTDGPNESEIVNFFPLPKRLLIMLFLEPFRNSLTVCAPVLPFVSLISTHFYSTVYSTDMKSFIYEICIYEYLIQT